MEALTEKYAKEISCVLSCYERIIIEGTLPEISHAHGMTAYLTNKEFRNFDYVKFAEPLKDLIKQNAEQINKSNKQQNEFVCNTSFHIEDLLNSQLIIRG